MPGATFVEILRQRAQDQADAEAFTFLDHEEREVSRLSYGELEQRAREIAAGLQRRDLAGEQVLLVFPPGADCVAGLYGCLFAGAVAVPAPSPDLGREYAARRIRVIASDARPRAVVTTGANVGALREILAEDGVSHLDFVAVDLEGVPDAAGWRDPGVDADDIAFLQYTSGTTSVPRGVIVTHANLIDNCDFCVAALGDPSARRFLTWLPPYHDMGLVGGMFLPVHGGFPATLMPPAAFALDPLSWLRAISRYAATASNAPDFAYDLCARRAATADRDALDLSSWEVAFNGAELIRRETIDAFCRAFEPCGFRRSAFYPCYGLAEATLMVTGGEGTAEPVTRVVNRRALEAGRFEPAESDKESRGVVGCGRAAPNARVVIADPDTRQLRPDGEVGEIWTAGPSITPGYWNRPEETAATFEATLVDVGGEAFLRTGDLGFVLDGELYVTGRIPEQLVLDGRAYYPTDVEWACQESVAELRRNCGAAFTFEDGGQQRLGLVFEVKPDADGGRVIASVRDTVAGRLGLEVGAIRLIAPRTIPRTTSGKIQRGRCRELFSKGRLEAVAHWPRGRP